MPPLSFGHFPHEWGKAVTSPLDSCFRRNDGVKDGVVVG